MQIHKAGMIRSRLRKKFLKRESASSRETYNKETNYCVRAIRKIKIKFIGSLSVQVKKSCR